MQALRQFQTADKDSISIKLPRAFQKRKLEIIVIPVDEKIKAHTSDTTWPKDFIERTAGCFAGFLLVREDQGVL